MDNSKKIILDLCGGTGAWSKPYKEAGYEILLLDIKNGCDIRLLECLDFHSNRRVYGILAAPPCTYFCRMRMCRGRPTDEQFAQGLSVVDACLRAVVLYRPKFWCLENPEGYLKKWLGEPAYTFQPYEFGHKYSKKTLLWGNFTPPFKKFTYTPHKKRVICDLVGKNRKELRSITPSGFAQAFFKANQ